jgi:acyl dehydratase
MGETLTARSRIASIRQKAGNGFLTIETEVLDRDGGLVVLARATMIERGA